MLDRILQVDSLFLVKLVKINILFVQSKPDCVNWHITYVLFLA